MDKKIFAIVVFLLFLAGFVRAENYVSETFPPNEIIEKTAHKISVAQLGNKPYKIYGRFKDAEGDYIVYFSLRYNTGEIDDKIHELKLRKLDTNIWLYWFGSYGWKIVEK